MQLKFLLTFATITIAIFAPDLLFVNNDKQSEKRRIFRMPEANMQFLYALSAGGFAGDGS